MKKFKHLFIVTLSVFLTLNYFFVDIKAEDTSSNVSYTVNHYKQDISKDSYFLEESNYLNGEIGETVTANIKSYVGYICDPSNENSVLSGVLVEGNNLTLNVYYKRITHSVSFNDGSNLLKQYNNVRYGTYISSLTDIPNPGKTGYKFAGWDENLENTKIGDNDLTINARFNAINYNVVFDTLSSSLLSKSVVNHLYDEEFTISHPQRAYYEFAGWKITGMDNSEHYFDGVKSTTDTITTSATTFKNLTSQNNTNISFTAIWNQEPVKCTINHYQMDTNGSIYDKVASEALPNVYSGSEITIGNYVKTFEGFEYEGSKGGNSGAYKKPTSFDTSIVIPNDVFSYEINLYYSRNKHKITLVAGNSITSMMVGNDSISAEGEPGSTIEGRELSKEVYYGEKINLMVMPVNQASTVYWTKDSLIIDNNQIITYTMGDEDVSLNVSAVAPLGNRYHVDYYLQNVDDDEYRLAETDVFFGTPNTNIVAAIKSIPGFTFESDNQNNVISGIIPNDNSLGLKLYYKRNTHSVLFKNGNDLLKQYDNVKYGTAISSLAKPSNPTRTGYNFSTWNVSDEFALKDEDLTINALFVANNYIIQYNLNQGDYGNNHPTSATYDKQFTVDFPTRNGYTFTGWTITGMDNNQHTIGSTASTATSVDTTSVIFKNLHATSNAKVTFTANWIPNQIEYFVKHYQMNIDGKSYSLKETETLHANVNSNVELSDLAKSYLGFTYECGEVGDIGSNTKTTSPDTTIILSLDSPKVINLYYSRNKHTITLNKGAGITLVNGGGNHYYGETVYLSANVKQNYSFKGWSDSNGTTIYSNNNPFAYDMGNSDINIKASGFSGNGSLYQVKYYKQNLDNDEYTCVDTVELNGEANSPVVANVKTFTGFTYDETNSNNKSSGNIKDDDSLVLSLYYKRNTHSVLFKNADTVLKKYDNVKYGTAISSLTEPSNPAKTGYTFKSWDLDLSTAELPDSDLIINAVFDANTYNISYDLQQGTYGPHHPTTVIYDQLVDIDNPVRQGYLFAGWSISGMDNNQHLIGTEISSVTETTTAEVKFKNLNATNGATVNFLANWDAVPISYTVNHYLMNTDGVTYSSKETEPKSGESNSVITINDLKKEFTGFTYEGGKGNIASSATKPDSFDETTTVLPDSSRVVNLYYSRNKHTITLTGDEGVENIIGDGEHYYGEVVDVLATVKPGYTFVSWAKGTTPVSNSSSYAYTMEDEDVSLKANTSINTDTHYAVKHMLQNIDDNEYTLKETEDLSGTTNDSVEPNVKTYVGFTSPSKQTVTINGDGSTVVEYKYDRHSYTVSFDGNGETSGSVASQTVKFDQRYILPNNSFVKEKNTFLRWQQGETSHYIGAPFIIDEAYVTSHNLENNDSLTFKAIWESNEPETEIKDSDFKDGEIQVVTSDKTEFNMKLASNNLQNIIGNAAAAGSVVWLESKKSEDNNLKTSTKTIIEEKTNLNCEIKECLDIKLFSQNKGEESKNIKEPASSVKITFKLETQENIDAAKAGKLVIYSIHDGVLDPNMIVGTFNEATNEYTFDTNKFSIFALTYLPNGIPKPAGESDNDHNSNKTSDKFVPPKTGIY